MNTICFVLANAFPVKKGGAELQAYNIAKGFVKKGYDVHYIHQSNDDVVKGIGGITWHRLPNLPRNYSIMFFNYPKLSSILDDISPDIVYQRGKNPYTAMVGYYCKMRDCRFVWGASSERGCYNRFDEVPKKQMKRYFNWKLGIYGIKSADAVVSQTKRQKYLLMKNLGLKSHVIPNGQYVPTGPFIKSIPSEVIWISNIKRLKRPEYFIRLAKELRYTDARFVMIGRPHWRNEYQNKLNRMISKVDNIEYIGELEFDEVNSLIEKASILINTSTREGFPNTYIQAWMRETPVVTASFDPDDVISNKGLGIKADDFESLVRSTKKLIVDTDLRKEMGKRSREYAKSVYDIDKITQKYEELFRSLL